MMVGVVSASAGATPVGDAGVIVAGGDGSGSAANQLNHPSAVAVDGHGDVFVGDENQRVQEWLPGASQGITVLGVDPNGMAVDSHGDLFVTEFASVVEWTPGAAQAVTVAGGNGFGLAADQLGEPAAVAVDPQGKLFIVDAFYGRV
jgi:hypothetical protein